MRRGGNKKSMSTPTAHRSVLTGRWPRRCADADDAELADARRTFVEEMRKWSFRGARAPAALAETLSDCDGEDDEGRVVGVRARSPIISVGDASGPPVLPPATRAGRGPPRRRAGEYT